VIPRSMTLFHVTPAGSLASILRSGLRIAGSHEGRPVVWLCDGEHLVWTLGHVAQWKGRELSSMRILSVACEPGTFTRVRPGTYLSWRPIPPDRLACSTMHARIVLESVIRFIMWRLQHGEPLAAATERARRADAFAGVSPDVFTQATRLAGRLSQPRLERAARS
jgi:hypothetical protein